MNEPDDLRDLDDGRTVTGLVAVDERSVLVELDHDEILLVDYDTNYVRPTYDKVRLQLQAQLFDDGTDFIQAVDILLRRAGLAGLPVEPPEGQVGR